MLERIHPKTAELLADAQESLLEFTGFPRARWKQICSTNPLARLNQKITRHTDFVSMFPNPAVLLQLVAAVLVEQNEQWGASPHCYRAGCSLTPPGELADGAPLNAMALSPDGNY